MGIRNVIAPMPTSPQTLTYARRLSKLGKCLRICIQRLGRGETFETFVDLSYAHGTASQSLPSPPLASPRQTWAMIQSPPDTKSYPMEFH